ARRSPAELRRDLLLHERGSSGLQWRLHHLLANAQPVEGSGSHPFRGLPGPPRRVACLLARRPSGQSAFRVALVADRAGRAADRREGHGATRTRASAKARVASAAADAAALPTAEAGARA